MSLWKAPDHALLEYKRTNLRALSEQWTVPKSAHFWKRSCKNRRKFLLPKSVIFHPYNTHPHGAATTLDYSETHFSDLTASLHISLTMISLSTVFLDSWGTRSRVRNDDKEILHCWLNNQLHFYLFNKEFVALVGGYVEKSDTCVEKSLIEI